MMQTSKNTHVCLFDISWRWNLICIELAPNLENQRRRGWAHWLHLHDKDAIGNGGRNWAHWHDGSAADDSIWSSPSDCCNLSSCFQHFCSWTSVNSKCLSWHNIFKKSVTRWLSLKGFDSTRNGNTGKCNCRDVKQKKCDSLIDGEI